MTTKELIEQLQKLDPSGSLEVTIGKSPIKDVEVYPCYYDGAQVSILRDEQKKIIGWKWNRSGSHIMIRNIDIDDLAWLLICDLDKDPVVDYSDPWVTEDNEYLKDIDKKIIDNAKALDKEFTEKYGEKYTRNKGEDND